MWKQLSQKAGLTTTELNVFIFLVVMFSAGALYKYFSSGKSVPLMEFDYSARDSLFYTGNRKNLLQANSENGQKTFDYKQEVLDFNNRNFNNVKPAKTAAEKSINLNTAGLVELMSIPGLGEKTAGKILKFRSENGNFRSLEQLKEIKGIGNKKFNKIKIYIFID